MGAVLGAAAIGCGDDPSGGDQGGSGTGEGDSTGSSGSSGAADGTGPTGPGDGSTSTGDESGSSDSSGEAFDECGSDGQGLAPEELLAPIDTIVVVMMENRSLDHYFGSATLREGWTLEGLTGRETNPRVDGSPVGVFNLTDLTPADPPHQWAACHLQWNMGANDGFVIVHEQAHPESYDQVMGYHVRSQIPVLYALADNYTLFDHWFGSTMAGTWPNRYHLHCGTSDGQQENEPEPGITTIWEILDDAGISHANYYSDVPWVWGALLNPLTSYTESLDEFFDAAAAGTLPQFSIIDPNYGLLPGGEGGNDDHPDHDITLGQIFLGSVYQALARSPQWSRCLLIITYDEHGGFFDHVSPPSTYDPLPQFQQLGHRVPSLVVGPYVRRGCVDSTVVDHVSVLSTVTRRFGLPPITQRVTQTADLSSAINPELLGNPQPPAPIPMLSVSISEVLSKRGPSQDELAAMIASGQLPLPTDRRHAGASREVALRLLDRASKLGVVKLRP
ncbi:MAG: alkaline phosphatase family protein [Myxococcales bacterium]|nr:alkaline phosphatase family protein [Myxococcales bacterium]